MSKAKKPATGLKTRYEYRSKKLSEANGICSEARDGDREAIKMVASVGELLMHDEWTKLDKYHEYALYLSDALGQIAQGVEPNIAFGWRKTSEHSKKREEFGKLRKHYALAHTVHGFVTNLVGQPEDRAYSLAAEIYKVEEARVRAALTTITGGNNPLSQALATDVAIEIVATYGAWGYRASEPTIRQAHFDWSRQD